MKNEEKFDPHEAEIESLDIKPKEIVYNPDNDAEAPFKIIAAERKNLFDWNNVAWGNLLEQVFKDMKINTKINDYWRMNRIKNDFKSINIDNFIENFKQTYPSYLAFSQPQQKEMFEQTEKDDESIKDQPRHSRASGRRKASYSD